MCKYDMTQGSPDVINLKDVDFYFNFHFIMFNSNQLTTVCTITINTVK